MEPLAIVGIGCRFPGGADDPEQFWSLLVERRSGIRDVPANRWDLERFYHADPAAAGAMVMRRGGFIDNLDGFDPAFWGISPREALRMDPQQRWLLEVAWEAIEDAGVPPATLRGRNVGVFVGISGNDYGGLQLRSTEDVDAYTNSGSTASIASNRVSYMLDLTGPSVSLDTACSSALVAVGAACDSIWAGHCEAALAGGVNALISPQTSVGFSKAAMVSPTGQCFAFDARANGFVRAEGAGVIYVKRLSDARASGQRIYALIRAVAVNQDGHTSSMTVPGIEGQSAMLEQAYRASGIDPARVAYVEAHGTGTPVGDPIEATALGRVIGRGRARPCLIGSVKTNIGHLESGSGIAGLIKAALVLHHNTIPATLNHERPNPAIPFDELGLQVATHTQPLPSAGEQAPVVGVNSFGFGGTNAHAVLEAAPLDAKPVPPPVASQGSYLLPISARDEIALRAYVKSYRATLADPDAPLADICASAGARKEHHAHRVVLIGGTKQELRKRASAWLRDGTAEGVIAGRAAPPSPPVFVFSGQGPQWWAMGRQLLQREPIVRGMVEDIDHQIQELAGWSLLAEMTRPEGESRIDQTDVAQPAIFALQVALAELWASWGVRPAKTIGHSVGEVAAAYCAGVYSLQDAVRIIVHRSRLQHTTFGGGRMLAAALSEEEGRAAIGNDSAVEIGAVNSPRFITFAGTVPSLEVIDRRLQERGVFTRWLRGGYAFHSAQMDPVREELLAVLADITPYATQIPLISTVTGAEIDGRSMDAAYWFRNIREPVRFAPAVIDCIGRGDRTFLEVSPHPVLESAIKECLAAKGETGAVFHSLRREADDSRELGEGLAALHVHGVPLNWMAINRGSGVFVRLPRYPWNRERFWIESPDSVRARLEPSVHPLLGRRTEAALPTWQLTLDLRRLPYLEDHRVWDTVVFPAAGYVEMMLAVSRLLFPDEVHGVEGVEIRKALFVRQDERTVLQTVFTPDQKSVAIYSGDLDEGRWDLHAQGTLARIGAPAAGRVDLDALRADLPERLDHAHYCQELTNRGYQFGPRFRQVQNIWREGPEALIEIEAPEVISKAADSYVFHPAILDACFHTFIGLPDGDDGAALYLPQSIERVNMRKTCAPARLWAHGVLRTRERGAIVADIAVYEADGTRLAEINGFRMERVEQKQKADPLTDTCYEFRWIPRRLRGSGLHDPCSFPASSAIAATVASAMADLSQRHRLDDYYDRFVPAARSTAALLAQRAFADLGWRPRVGDRITAQTFMEALGIEADYAPNVTRLLRHFAALGLLRESGAGQWDVVRLPDGEDAAAAVERLAQTFPEQAAEVELFRRTGLNLAQVLAGDTDPLELLFPGGSHDLMERYYAEALAFPAHLELAQRVVVAAVEGVPKRRAIRILEVGAGTGILTRTLLPHLPASRTEYLFTDVGATFVAAARKRFANVPFVDYQTLDIESDPAAQGIAAAAFDLVIAADVVHATADVRQVLRHLRGCLAPGGLLLLLELSQPDMVRDDVTFGLLRGYSRFSDTDIRPYSPLMTPDRWQQVLTDAGFAGVRAVTCPLEAADAEHAVVIGFAPAETASASSGRATATDDRGVPYLLVNDATGIGDALAVRLHDSGRRVVIAGAHEDLAARVRELPELAAVIHCGSLDHRAAADMTADDLTRLQQGGVLSGLDLVQALGNRPVPVWFVTRRAHSVAADDVNGGLAAAPLTGFVRVANNELQRRFFTVDLGDAAPDEAAISLFDEVTLPRDGEFEVAYRDGVRHACRLERVAPEDLPRRMLDAVARDGSVTPFRVQTDKPGILANLRLHETRRVAPGPGEIEVRVHAGGLNFRDVMKALGTHPGNPPDLLWFGDDFSGTVERVGANVGHLRPGDRVAGMAPYAFRSFVSVDARLAFKLPRQLSFEEATTIPTVFLTAHYSMNHLAHLRAGESILIHAGTGGVGLAAIQIAKHLGLEIFATAGTPQKRELLTSMGVPHVMNSRSLEFADEILSITGGRGVDAVLNSLAGDFIPKSLSVLAPFGRFLEIGKVDIYRNSKLGLQRLRDNISYFVIDLTQHLRYKPDFVVQMFEEIRQRFEHGDYQPIAYTPFPVSAVVDAFRFMAQGKHVGKNVLTFDHPTVPIALSTEPGERFSPDATYLVSGGAGGFGLEVAKWIAAQGARHLVLMSRSGPPTAAAAATIDALRSSGVTVVDARGDVTVPADVTRVVSQIQRDLPPLKGVFHAAMVLDDDLIEILDRARFEKAVAPKMLGAWNLHTATKDLPLDHFVCFSSFSNVIGMLRQSNYNAGNAFLDALAEYRRASGLPALSVNWGAITGAGFVDRDHKTAETLTRLGFGSFDKDEALEMLDRLLRSNATNVAAARVDWQVVMKLSPLAAASNTYAALAREATVAHKGGTLEAQLRSATPDEQDRLLETFIVSQVAGVFGLADEKISRTVRLNELGLDSLMTLELTNRVERELGVRIPMGTLLGGPTIVELARSVRQLLAPALATVEAGAVAATAPVPESNHLVPIKPGDGSPIYCFHPVGGGVGIYTALAPHLPQDLELVGVESRLVQGSATEYGSREEMVDAYAAAIRAAGPGPYRLLGFSFGGYIAACVAEQLENSGETVELVGVLDWDAQQKLTDAVQRESLVRLCMASYAFMQEEMGVLRPLPEHELRADISRLVTQVAGESTGGGDAFYQWVISKELAASKAHEAVAREYLGRFEQHCRLLTQGLPRPSFRAPMLIWRARDGFGSGLESWDHLDRGREYVFDGDHNSLMRPGTLRLVAEQLLEFLSGAGADEGIGRDAAQLT